MKKAFIFLLGVTILYLSASNVIAGDDTTVYKNAKEAGVTKCLKIIQDVSAFIIKKNKHSSHDYWSKKNVNSTAFSSFVVKDYSDGDSHISIMVVPDANNNCYAEYRETSYWNKSCSVLREEIFKDWKYKTSLKESTVLLANEKDTVHVYLTPQNNGSGCLSTKREAIY